MVRHSQAVRPWKHALDCLNGRLMCVEVTEKGQGTHVTLNFEPDPNGMKSVFDVLGVVRRMFLDLQIETGASQKHRGTGLLALNSQMDQQKLRWERRLRSEGAMSLRINGTVFMPERLELTPHLFFWKRERRVGLNGEE